VIRVSIELGDRHAEALVRLLRNLTFEKICTCASNNQERYDLIVAIERLRMALEDGGEQVWTGEAVPNASPATSRAHKPADSNAGSASLS